MVDAFLVPERDRAGLMASREATPGLSPRLHELLEQAIKDEASAAPSRATGGW